MRRRSMPIHVRSDGGVIGPTLTHMYARREAPPTRVALGAGGMRVPLDPVLRQQLHLTQQFGYDIFTFALFEKPKPIRRSKMSRLAWLCEAQKAQTHQMTISTFGEVFLRNHASPSRLLTGRKRKNAACFFFPQAQLPAKPWSHETARPWVK